MHITPINNFNYKVKLRTNPSNLKNRYSETSTQTDTIQTSDINFKGRSAKALTVLGTAFGACFGPIGAGIGAALGNKYGNMIDKGAEEFEKSGFDNGNYDSDPDNMSGR